MSRLALLLVLAGSVALAAAGSASAWQYKFQGLTQATADFWNTVSARWKPGKLSFKHGSLVIFGAEVLSPGKNTVDFKPKPGC
jgi:hypothetical protein